VNFVVASYAAAAVGYGLLTLVLLLRREPQRQGLRVLYVVGATAVWGLAIGLIAAFGNGRASDLIPAADALRTLVLVFSLLAAMPGEAKSRSSKGVISIAAVLAAATAAVTPFADLAVAADLALLALAVIGCLTVEQILRNSTAEQKSVVDVFLFSIGALLVYDLFVFSDALLFNAVDLQLWAPRGLLAAIALPFFVLAAKRHPDWQETLFISRGFVFYTATLTGVGVYLLAMAIGGFIIRDLGGEWGAAIQLAYLVAAMAILGFVLSSGRLRSKLRVFISKHFYRNRYDYREEWLRLIRTLSASNQELPIDQRSIKALCDIVGSDGGQLWLDRESRSRYEPFGAWQGEFPTGEFKENSPLVRFLKQQQWVVDSTEYESDPERYQHAFRDAPHELPAQRLVVPLMLQNELLGILQIKRPPGFPVLNYEDHDLLKTAGRQVSAFLAHDLARERLAQASQFDAYHRLSAFVMHDLKNVLAQQALLASNARKFRDRPEFVDDMIRTVENGVQRMRRLMQNLNSGTPLAQLQRVELNKLILRVVSACSEHNKTACTFAGGASYFWVRANPEQLASVVTHLIQNAQEATTDASAVLVTLSELDQRVAIEIRDYGQGMTEEFIRRRLFKPFETTKGSAGMGVGAYQAREIVRGLGGDLVVASEPGRGTRVTILLPCERSSDLGRRTAPQRAADNASP
jgi:putative PEP-CTERM system histidine kinase